MELVDVQLELSKEIEKKFKEFEGMDRYKNLYIEEKYLINPWNSSKSKNENIVKKYETKTYESDPDIIKNKELKKKKTYSYQQKLKNRNKLPIFQMKDKILENIESNQVTIVQGTTGCGKSTQICQYIYNSRSEKGLDTFILCSQPRRISAVSLAERVAWEQNQEIGNEVGYSIRFENERSFNTKILFCTTGVCLQILKDISNYKITHLIIDEVHERSLEIDLILLLVKDIIQKRKDLKLILMTATLSKRFSEYFNCNVIEVPGKYFEVKEYYQEDIVDFINYQLPVDTSQPDNKFIIELLKFINEENSDGILIFLPGINEIKRLEFEISKAGFKNFEIHLLHSSISLEDQNKIFQPVSKGNQKLIISTNIAETSITIDDVSWVINYPKMKEMVYDHEKLFSSLEEIWISKSNCKQRAGRAGRVKNGHCFHLFSKKSFQYLTEFPVPEVQRISLEHLCLKIINWNPSGGVNNFIQNMVDPPPKKHVERALQSLNEMNAIVNEDLTPLGKILIEFPVSPKIGKMIVYATLFKCLDPILTIAAHLSTQSSIYHSKKKDFTSVFKDFGEEGSDHLTILNIYNEFINQKKRSRDFCKKYELSYESLNNMFYIKNQISDILYYIGLMKDNPKELNLNSMNKKIIKACLCIGLYPNIIYINESRNKYQILEGDPVSIHPTSILPKDLRRTSFHDLFVVYHDLTKTTKVFLRDGTTLSIINLILFCKELTIDKDNLILDKNIRILCKENANHFLRLMRHQFIQSIQQYLQNSSKSEYLKDIIDLISF